MNNFSIQTEEIDFVKIDVELHEPELLEGATEVIKKFSPFILFEVLVIDVVDKWDVFFENKDYTLFEFISIDGAHKLKAIDKLEGRPEGNWNYFGCPNSKLDQLSSIIA